MAVSLRPLLAGNWKMNGLQASLSEIEQVVQALGVGPVAADLLICPPATLIAKFAQALGSSGLLIGGQDCHAKASGAHTGDISAAMLKDAGATWVIVGHSERRSDHGETSSDVRLKAEAARVAGLGAIVCVGETLGERRAGLTLEVITRQLAHSLPVAFKVQDVVVAYEPVWAIGTGLTPSLPQVTEVHAALRTQLTSRLGPDGEHVRLLYGGSVKPENALALMSLANVNGALVGGASLKAADFLGILRAMPGYA